MKESWRWFGSLDKLELNEIRQSGANEVVTALHEIPYGEVWERKPIAENNYPNNVIDGAKAWYDASTTADHEALLNSIMSGLPGAYDRYDISGLQRALKTYDGITSTEIRANYKHFLMEVVPTAEEFGMRLCVHPDAPSGYSGPAARGIER